LAIEHEYSVAEEIADVSIGAPHVVVLGAGASLAAFPNGDKNSKRLPIMANFVDVVGLQDVLAKHGVAYSTGQNFEEIYSSLHRTNKMAATELNKRIEDYFSGLELPDEPTLYDHLVLSLREKDFVATFNWDPFLYQACLRNHKVAKMPKVAYLHGSVAVGFCEKDRRKGMRGTACSVCGELFTPTPLLYPIQEKDYNAGTFARAEWEGLKRHMNHAMILTIFGYGAPRSDVEAIKLMKGAWGDINKRSMEETEIIDIRSEDELHQNWAEFIHTHHYEVHGSFYDSWIAKHPRRSCEAAWQQFYEAKFIDQNPLPVDFGFDDLYRWVSTLTSVEGHQ
jgi:hypothetical protein